MQTKDFDYYLPEELIAQTPLEKRDESRLMCLDKETGELSHHHFYELPDFLNPGDCLILNNSRVLPARLLGQRLPGGGACEVLLLIDRGNKTWECIVRPGKHLRKGAKMQFGNGELKAEVVDVLPDGNRMVKFDFEGIFLEVLEHLGDGFQLGIAEVAAHRELGHLLGGDRRLEPCGGIADARVGALVPHHRSPPKSNLASMLLPLGGSICATAVPGGTLGSSTGCASRYWSSQKESRLPHVTGCTASSRDRSSL